MTEIKQLRKDIATLETAERLAGGMPGRSHVAGAISSIVYDKRAELAKLEAEAADPWQEHKEVLSGRFHTQQGADHDEKLVLNYAMHLQQTNEKLAFKARLDAARIAELEAELARRPVVWCVRYGSGYAIDRTTGITKLFPTFEAANDRFGDDPDFVIEPYTGEQK